MYAFFIDGSNFYHALKDAGWPVNIDFGRFAAALVGPDRRHVQTYYYNTPLPPPNRSHPDFDLREKHHRAQQRFFNALRFVPNLTFRKGRFQRLPDGRQVEKLVDAMLAVDMLRLAFKDRYDVAILVSSDADYKHAVETVKDETGKRVELHQVDSSRAYDLTTACTSYHPIPRSVIEACLRARRCVD